MRYKMKKSVLYIGILFLAVFVLHAFAYAQPDEKLFQEAKILIFDKEWKKAQEKLEQLMDEYPDSPWFSQAVFYRAKCLKEQGGKERDALRAFQDYLKRKDRSRSLSEDAETDIIELAYELYQKGRRSYVSEIEQRLSHSNRVIRYFAAIRLSHFQRISEPGKKSVCGFVKDPHSFSVTEFHQPRMIISFLVVQIVGHERKKEE